MILPLLNYPQRPYPLPPDPHAESLPLEVILERAKAAETVSQGRKQGFHILKTCQVIQGPIKKSKKQRDE